MADSKYYYRRYKEKFEEVKKYERALKELRDIERNLVSEQNNEINDVNRKIHELGNNLANSIQDNQVFSSSIRIVYEDIESSPSGDRVLSGAVRAIQSEMSDVNGKMNEAIRDRDYYWKKYREAKDEEQQEFWSSLW